MCHRDDAEESSTMKRTGMGVLPEGKKSGPMYPRHSLPMGVSMEVDIAADKERQGHKK